MKSGIGGALIGLVLGLVLGTALFGPIGGAVGVILGSALGFLIVTPLVVAYVSEAAKQPFIVNCPETQRDAEVTFDPKQAARAELWNRKKQIATCSRYGGHPDCDEECVEQVEL